MRSTRLGVRADSWTTGWSWLEVRMYDGTVELFPYVLEEGMGGLEGERALRGHAAHGV